MDDYYENICHIYCFCPHCLTIKLNFNISKKAYYQHIFNIEKVSLLQNVQKKKLLLNFKTTTRKLKVAFVVYGDFVFTVPVKTCKGNPKKVTQLNIKNMFQVDFVCITKV